MRKTYVLDTSVLIHSPDCIEDFKENDVIIPIVVLEELDNIKSRQGLSGINARTAIRNLDNLTKNCNCPANGVKLDNDIVLYIDIERRKDERFSTGGKDDNILSCAAHHSGSILVSKDINMRLIAKSFSIQSQDFLADKVNTENLYTGYIEMDFDQLGLYMDVKDGYLVKGTIFEDLYPNQCVKVTMNGKSSLYIRKKNLLKSVKIPDEVWGLKSRNMYQACALQMLLDPEIALVTLSGKSGCGKTLVSVASAIFQVLSMKRYNSVEFYKVIMPLGKDLGYLPGTLNDKITPWIGSILNSLSYLFNGDEESALHLYKDKIKVEALTYIRGKSLNKIMIIADECQNLTKQEIKTLITRVGYDSKIVLTGDLNQSQIDSPYLDVSDNGLAYVIENEAFKKSELCAHLTLQKGERSALATFAAEVL